MEEIRPSPPPPGLQGPLLLSLENGLEIIIQRDDTSILMLQPFLLWILLRIKDEKKQRKNSVKNVVQQLKSRKLIKF